MKSELQQENEEEPPSRNFILPRGEKARLTFGGLPEVVTPYLINLIGKTGGINGPIGKQFIAQPEKENRFFNVKEADPLSEDRFEVIPGLVYKYRGKKDKKGKVLYHGRVLWTITRFCASYCRFCTRGREVGLPPGSQNKLHSAIAHNHYLTYQQIDQGIDFIKTHPEINEVILSGGDPLFAPKEYLNYIIKKISALQKEGQVEIVRIGTRLPVHSPLFIKDWHYSLLKNIHNPYLMVHFNHPEEITPQVIKVLDRFRQECNALILSQTVLLKGVNDSLKTLYELFVKLTKEGVRPYYLYQNDPVCWSRHFTVEPKKAIRLWQQLRPRISGLAGTARFVIDTPFGFGKIPLPEGDAWKVDYSSFNDFKKKPHLIDLGH